MNFDQSANRRTRATIELWPLKMPMHRVLNKHNASQNAAQVSGISHVLAEKALRGNCDTPSSDRYAEPKQIFGAHWNDHEKQQNLVRKQECKRRGDTKSSSRRAHNLPAKRKGVILQTNRVGKHARERLA